jgi:hypothetical protein
MATTQTIPWKRIAVEAAAIVASILLAFAIDAWWEDRQTRIDEQQFLLGLRSEFATNREILGSELSAHLKSLESLEDILTLIEGGQTDDARLTALAALDEMQAPRTIDLGNGTLNALLSSGRVEILQNRELRTHLTAWEGVIGEVLDDQHNNAKMSLEIYIPYFVAKNYSLFAIERSSDGSAAIKQMSEDPRLRHLVEIRLGFKRHLTGELETAIAAAEEILAEIETSIVDRD